MNRKPVSVISGPVRLSGRRCQAISPHAMNDPPTERLTTATAVTGSAPRNRKTNAANSAATPSGQSRIGSRSRLSAFLMLIRPPLAATARWLEGEPTPVEIRFLETASLLIAACAFSYPDLGAASMSLQDLRWDGHLVHHPRSSQMTVDHRKPSPSPVRIEGTLDEPVSRWQWVVKWLLVIPHGVVLVFLWIAFSALSIVALFAILINGRYPRSIFDFNAGVLRWTWRVGYYSYSALGPDRSPPFTLGDVPGYPARLEIEYPASLSRRLVLVKWWLLALPHYLILAVLGGVRSTLIVLAGVVILFTGRYPRSIFDLALGIERWAYRVVAYAALMTDEYPPFRLDVAAAELRTDEYPPFRLDTSHSPRRDTIHRLSSSTAFHSMGLTRRDRQSGALEEGGREARGRRWLGSSVHRSSTLPGSAIPRTGYVADVWRRAG